MSLVGYDYSDDEEGSESLTPLTAPTIKHSPSAVKSSISTTNSKQEADKVSKPTISTSTTNKQLSQLPSAVQSGGASSSQLSQDLLKRTTVNGRIQIAAPSLQLLNQPDSDEDSEDEEASRRKRFKRSDQGSGLISMLPKPQNPYSKPKASTTSSLTSLVPNSVTNRPKAPVTAASKKPSTSKVPAVTTEEDEEEITVGPSAGSSNFFFLNNDSDQENDDAADEGPLKIGISAPVFATTSQLETPLDDAPLYGPAKPEFAGPIQGDSLYTPDPEPIDPNQDVTYKKFIASKFGEEPAKDIRIVDFDMSKHLSQNQDWIKNITVEKSVEDEDIKGDAPNSTARRKNQITYLAYQAKKREVDLKNQWAQNRQTKAQTKAKYGF